MMRTCVLVASKKATVYGISYPRQYTRRSKKWSFVYVGPYTVLKKVSDLTYQIQKSKKAKPIVVHVDKLKRCLEPAEEEVEPEVRVVWSCRLQE